MEIPRQQAIALLRRWKQNETTVGLQFAARGGTAGSTMLARVRQVSSRVVFVNESSVLSFGLYQARFALSAVQVMLRPSRDGLRRIDGLHIWLASGHWLFVCDGDGLGSEWLESGGFPMRLKGPKGSLESRAA